MKGLTDFHTHVLPCVDDGSTSMQMSVSMLEKAWEQGVTTVIATPHFYAHNDEPQDFLSRRAEAEQQLRRQLDGMTKIPELKMGAEVYYFPGISDSDILSELTIDGKQCILIEMPTSPWTDHMYRELEGIYVKQGLIPIIAHIDRYISPFRTYGIPAHLKQLPVLVQANAGFFLRRSTRTMALRMLRSQQIQLLGSDCHDLELRPPNLGEAVDLICRHLGEAYLEHMHVWETDVLCNESV